MQSPVADQRYGFGRNWSRYLRGIDHESTAIARDSLIRTFGVSTLSGRRFLDIGSGSGLFSLAAHELGANVHSFDYDLDSVACTMALREHAAASESTWTVEQGSILDERYLARLGKFDIVYSWGVLHHTGSMWQAIDNALGLVAPDGQALMALYNDQGWRSRYWTLVKIQYNRGALRRAAIVASHTPPLFVFWLGGRLRRLVQGQEWRSRGMRFLTDTFDWLGGYPFEVAARDSVVAHAAERGFRAAVIHSVGHRMGCNEFLLQRAEPTPTTPGEGR